MKVRWRTQATRQVEQALRYTETHFGRNAALCIAKEIDANNNRLTTNPYLGPAEPALSMFAKTYRYLMVNTNYKMIYTVGSKTIFIVALWHTAINPKQMNKFTY